MAERPSTGRFPIVQTAQGGLRFGGRTLRVTVHVNTDEDEIALAKRIDDYVSSTGCQPLTLSYAQEMPAAVSGPLWARVIRALEHELKLAGSK